MDSLFSVTRRRFITRLAAVPMCALGAAAQGDDNRPLQIIVGYPAGGGTDVLARVLGEPLSKLVGRPVIVRNVRVLRISRPPLSTLRGGGPLPRGPVSTKM